MPSPFPGMDPYLEVPALWPGLHQRLITYISDTLTPTIRPTYSARIGERIYVVESRREIYPDVTLVQRPTPPSTGSGVVTEETIPVAEPYVLQTPIHEYREPFIELVHNAQGDVVTVIEILSPANKTGEGQKLYYKKQQEVLQSKAHLVEIDLLSQGEYTLVLPESELNMLPAWRYLIAISRFENRPHTYEVYPMTLTQRLPIFRIPLRQPDPDVILDLQTVFDQSYDNGGYSDFVDYNIPPEGVSVSPKDMEAALAVRRDVG